MRLITFLSRWTLTNREIFAVILFPLGIFAIGHYLFPLSFFPRRKLILKPSSYTKRLSREFTGAGIGQNHEKKYFDSFVESIVSVCYDALNCEKIFLTLLSKENEEILFKATKGCADSSSLLRKVHDFVIQNRRTVRIEDLTSDKMFYVAPTEVSTSDQDQFVIYSVLSTPVFSTTGGVVGILSAVNKLGVGSSFGYLTINKFSKSDEAIIEIVAGNTSMAIERAKKYHHESRQHRKWAALLSIVRARTSEQTIEEILDAIIKAAYELLLPEKLSVYFCDHRKREAWICVSRDDIEGLTVKFGEGVAGTVAATGETIRIENAYEDPRFLRDIDEDTGFSTKSMLCAPVPGFGTDIKPIAVIQLINKRDGGCFDEEDEEDVHSLCEEVSLAFRDKMLDMTLLEVAHSLRDDQLPDTEKEAAYLEESLLKEYASMAQRSQYKKFMKRKDCSLYDSKHDGYRNSSRFSMSLSYSSSHFSLPGECLEAIDNWNFDPFEYPDSDLMLHVDDMFAAFNLVETYNIDLDKLHSFIKAVHAKYHAANKFHNFKHAWSVLQVTFMLLRHGGSDKLTTLETLATLIAAFCHDLDHPGVSNAFEIASGSPLSVLYGDEAVLERHHTAETLRLLRMPENDILENLSYEQKREMRRLLNSGIMATDMAHHFDLLASLVSLSKSGISVTSASDRRDFMGILIHCADLSGQVMTPELAKQWSTCVSAEFSEQALREKELGLPLTPHIQGLESELTCMQLQYGFVDKIVVPLWSKLSELLPGVRHMVEQANDNLQHYKARADALAQI